VSSFTERLRSEIEYAGLTQKELADRAGIKKRALDMYLGYRECMPPADIAVKIAAALGLSVEYLITGKNRPDNAKTLDQVKYREVTDCLPLLSESTFKALREIIRALTRPAKD
jgi:transcriptional regulator with XRE-family HTH domain